MTNKFSHTNQVQKPPHICRKPPPGPRYIPPPISEQIMTGFAEYFQPETPGEGGMISPITLYPTGPPDVWFGTAKAGDFEIKLLMASDIAHTFLQFRLDWFVSGGLVDTVIISHHLPRAWSPFDSGQVTPHPQPYHGKIAWRLWA